MFPQLHHQTYKALPPYLLPLFDSIKNWIFYLKHVHLFLKYQKLFN